MFRRNRCGQSLSDYALAIGVVVAMMAGMQTYIQRAIQAQIKDTTDDVLAISEFDATNPSLDARGRLTQLKGIDRRQPNTGINGGSIVADVQSASVASWDEGIRSGRRIAIASASNTATPPNQQFYFEAVRSQPEGIVVSPRQWFHSEKHKQREREGKVHPSDADRRRMRKHPFGEAETPEEQWERAKAEARACYADEQCRRRYEDPTRYRHFARQWNRRLGKSSPYRLDPDDPTAGFKKMYGVSLEDGASGWSGSKYEEAPSWWGQADASEELWRGPGVPQYPLVVLRAMRVKVRK